MSDLCRRSYIAVYGGGVGVSDAVVEEVSV